MTEINPMKYRANESSSLLKYIFGQGGEQSRTCKSNSQDQDQFSTLGDTKSHSPSALPLRLLQKDRQLNSGPPAEDTAHHNLET